MPAFFAEEVVAALVECPLNTDVSMPASIRSLLIHLLMVDDETGWCGFLNEIRRGLWVLPASTLKGCVLLSYSLSVATGHSWGSSEKAWKVMVLGGPDRLVLVRPGILKVTPPSVKDLYCRSSACMSEALFPLDRARSIVSFMESLSRSNSADLGIPPIKPTTWLTLQIV